MSGGGGVLSRSIMRAINVFRMNPDRAPYIHPMYEEAYRLPSPANTSISANPPKEWDELKYDIKLFDRDNTPSGKLQLKTLLKFDPSTHAVVEQVDYDVKPLPFDATQLPSYEWIEDYPEMLKQWTANQLPPLPGRACKWKLVEPSDT